jgi:hypothetical protein
MKLVTESRIAGPFRGWEGSGIYILANGQVWKQLHHQSQNHYDLDPKARVWQVGSKYFLEVAGMLDSIEVSCLTPDCPTEPEPAYELSS